MTDQPAAGTLGAVPGPAARPEPDAIGVARDAVIGMTTGTGVPLQRVALLAAERLLIDTAESVFPDLPAPVLFDYVVRYRAHLVVLVAARRGSQTS